MIQQNELRIGNWVKFSGYEHYSQLTIVRRTLAKSAEPIPLTEELIEKQGWEKVGYYYTDKNGLEIYETNDGWLLHIDDNKCQTTIGILVKSVHELQNAYFIATKKELEVSL